MQQNVLQKLNLVAGRELELTIRGERKFTFWFDAIDREAANRVVEFFKNDAVVEVDADSQLGTCIYVDLIQRG